MSQYGSAQNVPYSGQQDPALVNNPRYQGQSGGTVPQGSTTGPQQESRYGAAPLSTTGMPPQQQQQQQPSSGYGTQQSAGYGSQQQTGYGTPGSVDPSARGSQTGYGSQQTAGYGSHQGAGMVDPNARGSQAGYGSQPTAGYGSHQSDAEFARDQPGYGQPGFGAPSEGQNTGSLWPSPATPPNAHKSDVTAAGQGGRGYGQNQSGYGQGEAGYGQNQPGHGQGDAGYGQGQPGKGGVVDKLKDAVGMGPRAQGTAPGQEYNPNVNHPNEERGFGGGLGHNPQAGYDQSQQLGDGYHTGMATGADAYAQPQQRREGGVDKVKDSVGAGPNSGYNTRTQTGNDAYVHGNHPVGMQDRVQGVNEPTMLGGEHGVNTGGVGRRDGGLGQGEHMPETMMGERRTEPGYDASKGHHLPGQGEHHQKLGGTGLDGHRDTGLDATNNERRGKGSEDTAGPYDSKTGTDSYDGRSTGTGTGTGLGTGSGTGTGTGLGTGSGTGTGTGLGTGTGIDDTGSTPPKKGLMTKIKEKLHH